MSRRFVRRNYAAPCSYAEVKAHQFLRPSLDFGKDWSPLHPLLHDLSPRSSKLSNLKSASIKICINDATRCTKARNGRMQAAAIFARRGKPCTHPIASLTLLSLSSPKTSWGVVCEILRLIMYTTPPSLPAWKHPSVSIINLLIRAWETEAFYFIIISIEG